MKSNSSNNQVGCPVCDQTMTLAGNAYYYDRSRQYNTSVYYCKLCDIFYRSVDNATLVDHYYAASYVQKSNEPRFFQERIRFFDLILSLAKKSKATISNQPLQQLTLVDFGSSYGHLLQLAKERGIRAEGIGLNEDLIAACRKNGLVVHKQLGPVAEKVDVVTAIDSLYYVPNCRKVLTDINSILKPDGVLLARITNRNPYVKFVKTFLHRNDLSGIGDATVSYSVKGFKRVLNVSGFRIHKIIPDYGKGKKLGFKMKLICYISYFLTLLTFKKVVLTPGIIVIAMRNAEI